MSANFDDAAINDVFGRILSFALATGRFDAVNGAEPKNAPGTELTCAVWVQQIRPIRSSGLQATSCVVSFQARIYQNFRSEPYDMIDPNVTAATTDLMGSISGDFDLGGAEGVRAVDLLGAYVTHGLQAQAGYVEIDRQVYRVMTITIPIIINDAFVQVALWRRLQPGRSGRCWSRLAS
jgi:hypothetical protein